MREPIGGPTCDEARRHRSYGRDGRDEVSEQEQLAKYDKFSDAEIYAALCEREPRFATTLQQMAQMQVLMGYSDEMILAALRRDWPAATLDLWAEGGEFRGRLILRGVHHAAAQLRAGVAQAHTN